MSSYVSRINQLDALQLDHEIHQIFSSRLQEISKLFSPGKTEDFTPELNLTLRSLILLSSLSSSPSTFGQKLLHLSYQNLTPKKSLILSIFLIFPKYLEEKFLNPNRILSKTFEKTLQKNLEKFGKIIKLLQFINLLLFLNSGKQPLLLERILGIWSKNVALIGPRTIGYSYMTRELLWHGLMELFTIGLPMINFQYLKRLFLGVFRGKREDFSEVIPEMKKNTFCVYCNETPVLPSHAGCRDVYCYYCLNGHFVVADEFSCGGCGGVLAKRNMKSLVVS